MSLECRNVSLQYPGTGKYVFKNLSFTIPGPGFNALFGPSGVGKTSLARILYGNSPTFSGEIETPYTGTPLYSYNLERLPGWSTIGRHLDRIVPAARHAQKAELVDLFGLEACMGVRFSQLSLGQKNRINLIRYLLQDFQLLIMDESLANVDERTREKIILKIKNMFPDRFFLYISHNVIEVSRFCKYIVVLRGAHKDPQALVIRGQNHVSGQAPAKQDLELTMLEIMNAS